MWESVWHLVSYPVRAVFTGRVMGVKVSRNPLHWISLWLWALVAIPLIVLAYPVVIVIMLVGGWSFRRNGSDARVKESGLDVFSKKKGLLAHYSWETIRSVTVRFDPPGRYPELRLSDGTIVSLHLARIDAVASVCEARGIPVDREARLRDDA
jgi:hypothetical protein